ncbi:MAG TPA: hypothetical protein VJ521_15620, partial [Acidobacteriota bacterium]|nr:hypothetical protein [Acidobacteriota bacterium]
MSAREWYARWFAEEGILGFHLVIGFLVALLSGGLFKIIADEVFTTPGIRSLDAQALAVSGLLYSPGMTRLMEVATFFGSGWTLMMLSIVIGLWLYFSGSHRRLYTFGAVMAGGNLLNVLLKDLFGRLRPSE